MSSVEVPLGKHEPVEGWSGEAMGVQVGVFAAGLSPLMSYYPPCLGVGVGGGIEWLFITATSVLSSGALHSLLLHDHTGRLGVMTGFHWCDWRLFPYFPFPFVCSCFVSSLCYHLLFLSFPSLSFPFLALPPSCPLFISSPLPSPLPRTNPIPCSHTQPELWVHSALIHCQSYLSSGTIGTERGALRTAACRKIATLPQGWGTLGVQQRQPSSLSPPRIKSSSRRVEKNIPASVCLTVVQMEFLWLQRNRRRGRMTNRVCTRCRLVSLLIYRLSFCLFTRGCVSFAVRDILWFM